MEKVGILIILLQVAARLNELVMEQGAQMKCQAGLVSGYQYTQ